ncbi:hypothetical protein [Flavobacterium anhuiense]|uniref:hypothetical protein n=1 Tax=Flavobacterium anhuiense TaxID=459526 RepID=UPI0020268724|nr:hypothetical protein [Flavobacterium anhuiense]URM37193.1 hypothetical protein LLY39_00950 [Flavobacterium anhuiense]
MATIASSNKKKPLKDEIYSIIRNDIPLRGKIADALSIEKASVYDSARRKSTKFSLPFVLEIISNHTGIKKEDLTIA